MERIVIFYGIFFVSMLIFSILIDNVLLRFAKTWGIRGRNNIIRWADTTKPALGGISFFIVFLLSTSFSAIIQKAGSFTFGGLQSIGIIFTVTIGFLMGLADDAYDTKPLLKFSSQLLCGIILILTGIYIQLFSNNWLNYLLTLFWVVGIMNAINMLDNMDGIASVVSIFIIISALLVNIVHESFSINTVNFILILGVLASVIGFLYYNWYPSKMYMGDTGSQFLGIFLAIMGIIYFWNFDIPSALAEQNGTRSVVGGKQIIIALLAFILPISDTTTVVINRLLKGKSPFIGGKDHTTHYLSYLIFTDSQIALIYAGISFISSLLIFLIVKFFNHWSILHNIIFGSYFLIIFLLLFINTRITKSSDRIKRARKIMNDNSGQ